MSRTPTERKSAKLSLRKKQIRTLSGDALDVVRGGDNVEVNISPTGMPIFNSRHPGVTGRDTVVAGGGDG